MIKLFTHTDLDGFGCAVLAKLAFENVDIEYVDYDEVDAAVSAYLSVATKEDMIYITDISISEAVAEEIEKRDLKVFLMDHHPTAVGLRKHDYCTVKIYGHDEIIKTSGTELFYERLITTDLLKPTDALTSFVAIVRDWDTWRWKELGEAGLDSKNMNELFYTYGVEAFLSRCMMQIQSGKFPTYSDMDRKLLEIKQKEFEAYFVEKDKSMIHMDLLGHPCGVVFAERFISELGNKLSSLHPECDFVVMIDATDQTISYRTVKDNIDLGKEIAAKVGGGGHPMAAGSSFSHDIVEEFIKKIFRPKYIKNLE